MTKYNNKILITLFFFFLAGLCEIGGGYLVWLWLREDMSWMIGALGGFILFLYGIVPTFQPSHFHRIYAAYGGIFIIMSVLWGWFFEGIVPDKYDIIGTIIAVIGVIIIYYMPRKGGGKDNMAIEEIVTVNPIVSGILFFVAAMMEIGGGYLVWLWIREKKTIALALLGGIILFVYGIIPTLQPANFGRVYAAYGGIFILSSIVWGMIVDKKRPDRYEIIGSFVAVFGAIIIFYSPR